MNRKIGVVVLLVLVISLTAIFTIKMKHGSATGISSSFEKEASIIEQTGTISALTYRHAAIAEFISLQNDTNFERRNNTLVHSLPNTNYSGLLPPGYFILNNQGWVTSKYMLTFALTTVVGEDTAGVTPHEFIPLLALLCMVVIVALAYRLTGSTAMAGLILLLILGSAVVTEHFISRYLREPLLLFCALLVLYYAVRYWQEGRRADAFVGSLALGFGMAVRETTAVMGVALAIAILARWWRQRGPFWPLAKLVLLCGLLVLVSIAPLIAQSALASIHKDSAVVTLSGDPESLKMKHLWRVHPFFGQHNVQVIYGVATGREGVFLVIAAVLSLLVLEWPVALMLLLAFIFNILLFGMWPNPWGRYALIAAPLATLLLALVFWKGVKSPWRRQIIVGVLVVMAALSLCYTLSQDRTYWSELLAPDIREEAIKINALVKQPALIIYLPQRESNGDNQGLRGYLESVSAYNDWVSPDMARARALLSRRDKLPYKGIYVYSDRYRSTLDLNVSLRRIYESDARSLDLLENVLLYEVK